MLYGEIHQGGRFRYTSAGHPPPLVWSREFGRLVQLAPERRVSQGLIGLSPASDVPVNEIELLGAGDILILATDGLTEHGDGAYLTDELPRLLARVQDLPASDIAGQLKESIPAFAAPFDDVTAVVIKRTERATDRIRCHREGYRSAYLRRIRPVKRVSRWSRTCSSSR
jgi:serine phosphatase RsbU (regulator of sigma subunit)